MKNPTAINWTLLIPVSAGSLVAMTAARILFGISLDEKIIGDANWLAIIINLIKPLRIISQEDIGIWEIFFSVFGLIYAIIVGLLIVEAHRRIRELSSAVQAELNALGDINDFLRYFKEESESAVQRVRNALLEYLNEVSHDMSPLKKSIIFRGYDEIKEIERKKLRESLRRRHISDIIDSVTALKLYDSHDKFALEAIIQKVGELTTFRAQKTEIARHGFPDLFYVILRVMTGMMILGFVILYVKSPFLHGTIVLAVSLSTTALYLIIRDLDTPLDGSWNIRKEVKMSIKTIKDNLIKEH